MEIYLVGGAVRDKLLGLPVKERDWVVVGTTVEDMMNKGFRPIGKDFPVFLHPQTHEEYALARTERKSAAGYRGFTVHARPTVTLKQDLLRRDLTINALAEDDKGNIIDHYGGREDLEKKLLRHTSPAFVEDPLRVLRVARFAARYKPLGFRVAAETLELMGAMVTNGEVNALVAERVWLELVKTLTEDTPGEFFEVLHRCGALAILLPELERLRGVPQPPKHHPEIDTWIHTLMVLSLATRMSKDTKVRFAALTHDLGKGTTPEHEWPRHIGHEGRGAALVEGLCTRLKAPKAYRNLARLVARYHLKCHLSMEMRPNTILKTLEKLDAFRRPDRFEQFLIACEADFRGRLGLQDRPYPQAGLLRKALEAARDIDLSSQIAAGLQGEALAHALREMRLKAISSLQKDAQ
ncbi:MAG: multifunctional CCA addition/repair protein [Gammaproteobacteria bacterium]|nr:multifunctional CCA addition/repair protein [Gammaproteobacteria bacterium]